MANSVKTKTKSSVFALLFPLLSLNTFKMSLLKQARLIAPDPEILCPNFLTMPLHFGAKRVIQIFCPFHH